MVDKKDSLSASTGRIVEAALKPGAIKVGKALAPLGEHVGELTTRAGRLILAPFRGTIWGAEQIVKFIEDRVEEKLKEIPEKHQQSPDAQIAGATIEALRYCGSKEELAEMFASLLAKSMDDRDAGSAHPSFVEIIKQLSPYEARIFTKIAPMSGGCAIIDLVLKMDTSGDFMTLNSNIPQNLGVAPSKKGEASNVAITNLIRLGLLRRPHNTRLSNDETYNEMEKMPIVVERKQNIGEYLNIVKSLVDLTPLGVVFFNTCCKSSNLASSS